MITGTDFVAVPSRDAQAARGFYGETLGLRADDHAQHEFWAGDTCYGIWEPEQMGRTFEPRPHAAAVALRVDDIDATRAELEGKGVTFLGDTLDTGVCKMAFFADPDGNAIMLHHRYAPRD